MHAFINKPIKISNTEWLKIIEHVSEIVIKVNGPSIDQNSSKREKYTEMVNYDICCRILD